MPLTRSFNCRRIAAWSLLLLFSSGATASADDKPARALGTIERHDPRFDKLVPPGAAIEILAEGFDWSEGPAWNRREGYLLFSDIPPNKVMKWKAGETVATFLHPSGYTGSKPRGGEPGSNGLHFDPQGRLVLLQPGDRRVARLEADGTFVTLADRYDGKRFNSPNDGAFKSNGDFYFTDPPYGLEGNVDDPAKELPFQGVYRLSPGSGQPGQGQVTLLTKDMTRPNGLAFSADEKTLYVANSDPKRAVWMAFEVAPDGLLGKGRVLFDSTKWVGQKKGLPDGMKVDRMGNLFATGPGGVLVFSPDGTHLGTLATGEATANCGWGDDGKTLYITADMYLCRVRTATQGAGW